MIVLMTLTILGLAVAVALQRFKILDQQQTISEYHNLVLEWYHYLHNKEYDEDFEKWRAELKDDI